jgi:hypothetical protein
MPRPDSVLDGLTERIGHDSDLAGALLLGSFATRTADELSDVDVLVVVREGRFDPAWAARSRLDGGEAIVAWDDVDPARAEIGGHKWLTRELVLLECLLATPSSGVRLAEPFSTLVGDASLPDLLERRAPIARDELEDFAQARADLGRAHPVETASEHLASTVHASRSER